MKINYNADASNGVVLIATDAADQPEEISVGMNGVVIVGANASEVLAMYSAHVEAEQKKCSF